MRVLVCGSRTFNDYEKLNRELNEYRFKDQGREFTEIIHGAARGADTLAGEYAKQYGIPVRTFPALWDKHGKSAGPIRNALMLSEGKPDIVFAFLGPVAVSEFTSGLSDSKYSPGTKNMIDQAVKSGIPVRVVEV